METFRENRMSLGRLSLRCPRDFFISKFPEYKVRTHNFRRSEKEQQKRDYTRGETTRNERPTFLKGNHSIFL